MKYWRQCAGTLALTVTMLAVSAAGAEPPTTSPERSWLRQRPHRMTGESPSGQFSLGRWSAVILLVGLSGFALWKGAKRRRSLPQIAGSEIQIGSVVKLTPKTQLAIVTVNGRSMLLGTTDVAVTRLMWLDETADDVSSDESDSPQALDERFYANEVSSSAKPRTLVQRLAPKVHPTVALPGNPAFAKSGSKFREILNDVIGVNAPAPGNPRVGLSPAETLAAATVDRFQTRSDRHGGAVRSNRGATNPVMVDCEGQAAGLIARLNRTQT